MQIPVLATALDGFELSQTYDPETNILLLQPYRKPPMRNATITELGSKGRVAYGSLLDACLGMVA